MPTQKEPEIESPVIVPYNAQEDDRRPLPKGLEAVGRVVHWERSPSFTDVTVLLQADREVRPGMFLGVWHGQRRRDVLTVMQVNNAFEVNPNEEPRLSAAREALGLGRGYAAEGVSTRIFRIAACSVSEEFEIKELNGTWAVQGEGQAAKELPRAGDPVVRLPQDVAIAAIGGKPDESDGIHLGVTYDAEDVPVTLSPEMLQLHVGLFGNPGRGKSYLGGNLLEEAVAWNVPTLVLDLNGETIDTAQALGGLVITLPDPEHFGLALHMLQPLELVAITPNVRLGTQYAELIEVAQDEMRKQRRGSAYSFSDLRKKIADLGEKQKLKASTGAAIARVSTLERDPLFGDAFDFVAKLKQHGLVVLDCRYLSLTQTRLIAAMGARHLQQIGRKMAREAEGGKKKAASWFALYFVDEAHSVIPDDDKVVSTQVFYELARMGRHVRTGLVLSSQSPQDLNGSVLKRLQTRFVFALEKDQLMRIQGVMADFDADIVRQLPKLPRGVCAVSGSSEIVRHGFLLGVRRRRTPVGGKTPPVFASRRKSVLNLSGDEG